MSEGWRIAGAGAGAFMLVLVLVPLCRRLALGWGITDRPAQGKLHRLPTPYLGGIAIALGAVVCSFVLPSWHAEAATVLAAACLVSVVGLVDDIRTVRPAVRLSIETVAAVAVVAGGARVHLFGDPADFVISVVFLVLMTNAFNLLDNMDGALGSIGAVIAVALATTALLEHQVLVGGLAVVVAGACFGFLVHNWHPARIFMGDAGSLFLGFLLAVIALKLRTGVSHSASAVALVLLLGPALFDTTLVVISRRRAGRPIYPGGTDHTAHRLMLLGLGPRTTTALLIVGTVLSTSLGVLVAEGLVPPTIAAPIALVAAVAGLFLMLRIGAYKPEPGPGELTARSRHPTAAAPADRSEAETEAPIPDPARVIDRERLAGDAAPAFVGSRYSWAGHARSRRRVQGTHRQSSGSVGGEVDT
jgi:UDP-GlcNAc:undecaprenyl-phosphate/decaprenyl-phosphate GlcNAc-1-phosphate transferase